MIPEHGDSHPSFIHLPKSPELLDRAGLALFFLGFFYLFYGGAAWLADLLPWRFQVGMDWEREIPFIPEAAAIYLTVGPMMLLSLFVIRRRRELRLLLRVFCIQTLVGALCFLLFPVQNNFATTPDADPLPWVYRLADALNLHNNELPSLHFCFAVTTAGVLGCFASLTQRVLLYLWALVIGLSTLLIHDHNLADLIAGFGLAIWGVWYWRSNRAMAAEIRGASSEAG